MVQLKLALSALLFTSANAAISPKAREFISTMKKVVKPQDVQDVNLRKTRKLASSVISKSEQARELGYNYTSSNSNQYTEIQFDLSKYSLKMHSCRSITSLDLQDNTGGNNYGNVDTTYPFTATPMVNFRLCPAETCHDNSFQGCRSDYGNYMISLEDYFDAVLDHEEEELQEYCNYCKQCRYFKSYFNAECDYYNDCENYADVCLQEENEYYEEQQAEEVDYKNFIECTEVEKTDYFKKHFEVNDGDSVYMKIFCDGEIKVGIFADDQCSEYIGDTANIYQATGLMVTEDAIQSEYMQHECVPCGKQHSKYFALDQETAEQMGEEYNIEDDRDYLWDICENLYQDAAKCNSKLAYEEYTNEWYDTVDESTCIYIEAVQKGNIDKYGFVQTSVNEKFGGGINWTNNHVMPNGYYLTDDQFFVALAAIMTCLGLCVVYSVFFRSDSGATGNKDLETTLV